MIRFYNTLVRRLEEFSPLEPGKVRMYNCGPTVYSTPHIGNYRAFMLADLLRRTLEYVGFQVTQVMNITDVGHLRDEVAETGDDKLEEAARKAKVDPQTIAKKYTDEFFAGLDLLGFQRAHHYPRATDNVPQMIEIISELIRKGFAYVVDHEVYYDVQRFHDYGKLSGNVSDEVEAGGGERISAELLARKRDKRDFALWKHDPHHLQQWESPWGRGFPGWHIECSAMSRRYLGDQLDVHTGGIDNMFPHHECEIAQSEAFSGKPFVKTWLHAAHLVLEGEKMSKSLGNVAYPDTLVAEGFRPNAIRFYLLSANYRVPMNFTREELRGKSAALDRLVNFYEDMRHRAENGSETLASEALRSAIDEAKRAFTANLCDDLNVSGALAAIFDAMKALNAASPGKEGAALAVAMLRDFDRVLNVLPTETRTLEDEIQSKIDERERARKAKDFKTSDRIRDELLAQGITLYDSPQGVRWRKV